MMKPIESLYLHFPFCKHLCNYCDFYKKVAIDRASELNTYHQLLIQNFDEHQKLMNLYGYSWGKLKTLYIGGGTPSLWGEAGSEFLDQFLRQRKIELDPHCEFTLEVNPGGWTEESLASFKKIGVNRFSLGIQSLNAEMIKKLDRVHSVDEAYQTLEYFKKTRANFSMDFMLGLPNSKEFKRDVIGELEEAIKYNPSHFSVYILTVKDNYTHFKSLPNEEWIEKEYLDVANFLRSKGYLHYEVSNFALPQKESVHNLRYWQSHTVAALGPSATGFLAEEKFRYKWKTLSAEYDSEVLTNEQYQLEKMYMALRSSVGINLNEYPHPVFRSWIEKGLAIEVNQQLLITSRGFLLLDSLLDELFLLKLI